MLANLLQTNHKKVKIDKKIVTLCKIQVMPQVVNSEFIIQRYNRLPEHLKSQVSEYIEFLLARYSERNTEYSELSEEIQSVLDARSIYSKTNPETRKLWSQVKAEILKDNEKL